jgi:competence protein ComEC
LAVVALALYQPPRPAAGCTDIDVLDVGQGLAVVVTTLRHAVVFDTGPAYRSGSSAADATLLPFLGYRGIRRIDKLVVSHADLDHSGGVATIRENVDVLDVLAGESLPGLEPAARSCVAGDSWHYDGVQFDFLHPSTELRHQGNDASCVLMIKTGAHRVLLTGDIERPAEEELIRDGRIPTVDAVIVPHHGSRTSSSLPFVRALSPSLAIVSASYGNRWGFPKQDVVARWQSTGAQVLATSTSGAIGLRLCAAGGLVSVTRQRAMQRRIWHE